MTTDVVAVAQRLLEQRRNALDALGYTDDLAWHAQYDPDMNRRHFATSALMMQIALEGVVKGQHDKVALAQILKDTLPAARHSTQALLQLADRLLKDAIDE